MGGVKLAIIGSRTFPDLAQVDEYVRSLPRTVMIVSGGARGVDRAAEVAATARRLSRLIYEPACEDDDEAYVAELHARNERIIRVADHIVAFHDGTSPGTLAALRIAKRLGKGVDVRRAR